MHLSINRPPSARGYCNAICFGPLAPRAAYGRPENGLSRRRHRSATLWDVLALGILLGSVCVGAAAQGKLYKYVDEQGQTVYSQQPPPGKATAQRLELIGVKPPADTNTTQRLNKQLDEASEKQKDQDFHAEMKSEEQQRQAALKKNCQTARENLRLLRDAPRLKTLDKEGKEVFVEDAERAARTEIAQKQIQDYCK